MGVAWRFRRAAFWRGAGLACLPWPGRRAARCNPSYPPAPPERTPLSAEPAKVTSALTNSINKTVHQGGHYLLIRDDGAGGSHPGGCCDSPTSGGQSGPKRARRAGRQNLPLISCTRLRGRGPFAETARLPTTDSPRCLPSGPCAWGSLQPELLGLGPGSLSGRGVRAAPCLGAPQGSLRPRCQGATPWVGCS